MAEVKEKEKEKEKESLSIFEQMATLSDKELAELLEKDKRLKQKIESKAAYMANNATKNLTIFPKSVIDGKPKREGFNEFDDMDAIEIVYPKGKNPRVVIVSKTAYNFRYKKQGFVLKSDFDNMKRSKDMVRLFSRSGEVIEVPRDNVKVLLANGFKIDQIDKGKI